MIKKISLFLYEFFARRAKLILILIGLELMILSSFFSGWYIATKKELGWQKEACQGEGGRWVGAYVDTKTHQGFVVCLDDENEPFLLYTGTRRF